jgi:hypothetical protein
MRRTDSSLNPIFSQKILTDYPSLNETFSAMNNIELNISTKSLNKSPISEMYCDMQTEQTIISTIMNP